MMRALFWVSVLWITVAASAAELKPLMAVKGAVVLKDDFSVAGGVDKEKWAARQGTRWSVADGVLSGIPSTVDYQGAKKDHKGFEPRVSSPVTPPQFVAAFSVRFLEGEETAVVPFVEFGHHVARVQFTAGSIYLLADHDTLKVAETTALKYEPGRWYHCLAELRGEEFVIQFANGPTLYGRHASYGAPPPSGAAGMGVAGPKGGRVELDDVTFWTIHDEVADGWEAARKGFPAFEPTVVKETRPTKGDAAKE